MCSTRRPRGGATDRRRGGGPAGGRGGHLRRRVGRVVPRFELSLAGEDLHRGYGLFTRHASSLPRRRIQLLRVEEGLLRRLLRLATLHVNTAGSRPTEPRAHQGRRRAPAGRGCEEVDVLVLVLFPDAAGRPEPVWRRVAPGRLAWHVPRLGLRAGADNGRRPDQGAGRPVAADAGRAVLRANLLGYRNLGYAKDDTFFRTRRGVAQPLDRHRAGPQRAGDRPDAKPPRPPPRRREATGATARGKGRPPAPTSPTCRGTRRWHWLVSSRNRRRVNDTGGGAVPRTRGFSTTAEQVGVRHSLVQPWFEKPRALSVPARTLAVSRGYNPSPRPLLKRLSHDPAVPLRSGARVSVVPRRPPRCARATSNPPRPPARQPRPRRDDEVPVPFPVVEMVGTGEEMGTAHGKQLGQTIRDLHAKYLRAYFSSEGQRFLAITAAAAFEQARRRSTWKRSDRWRSLRASTPGRCCWPTASSTSRR